MKYYVTENRNLKNERDYKYTPKTLFNQLVK